MDAASVETALLRLRRSLGLGAEEGDKEVLTDALERAEEKICRYLRTDSLPTCAAWLQIELAAMEYQRMTQPAGEKTSESYTEGQLSQSASYLTPEAWTAGELELLSQLAPYRKVACKGGGAQ